MKILGKLLFISLFCSSVLFSNSSSEAMQKAKSNYQKTQEKKPYNEYLKKANLFLGGNLSLGISSNKDFVFDLNDFLSECEIKKLPTKYIKFNQDLDYGNGFYAGIGYMLNPNMQIAAEIGYSEFKNKNKNSHHHDEFYNSGEITSDIFHGMISFTQYFDNVNCHFKPYASVGAGFARIDAEGNLDFEIKELIGDDYMRFKISFSDLEKFTFAYQFGLGFETINAKNCNFGIGYKYFATHGIETHDDDLNLKTQINSENVNEFDRVDFGSLKHQNHMLNFFLKFNI